MVPCIYLDNGALFSQTGRGLLSWIPSTAPAVSTPVASGYDSLPRSGETLSRRVSSLPLLRR